MNDLVGRIIAGNYRVDASLGKGGMAEVFKVWDHKRWVHLAMKILHADLAEDKVFLRRFRREARTLEELRHPNIVRFYGLEKDDDLTFMLMEYVEGTTLRKEIFKSEAPLEMERIAGILRPVCYALNYAHNLGFVHCDVKPANIMIHNNGTILVADFGIARMTEASTMTMVGIGTPAYMSPEQVRGENPSAASDIYALGVALFELLTGGERPFTGEHARTTGTTGEKIRWEQLNKQPPSPAKYNRDLAPDLSNVVLKCLEKDPDLRFKNALELLNAFEQSMTRTTAVSYSPEPEVEAENVEKPEPEIHPVIPDPGPPVNQQADFKELMVSLLRRFKSAISTRPLVPTQARKRIPFGEGSQKWLPWVVGAVLVSVILFSSIMLWSFARVGSGINQNGNKQIQESTSVQKTLLVTSISGKGKNWSPVPDGRGNLYFTSDRDGGQDIYVLTSGHKTVQITNNSGKGGSWEPAPDGYGNLYFTSNRDGKQEIYALTVDKKTLKVTDTPGKAESWSPLPDGDGNLYFTSNRDGKREIYALTSDKKTIRVTDTPGKGESWSPAPDGHGNVYFTSDRDGTQEIYALTSDHKTLQITNHSGKGGSWEPAPDGYGNLYFTSDRDGRQEIYVLTSDHQTVQVTNNSGKGESWSPASDGHGNLYFTSDRAGKQEIYVLTSVH